MINTIDKKIKVAFIGVGWIGLNRMDVLLRSGKADARMISDISENNAYKAALIAPKAKLVRSIEEINNSDVDGVVIATPSGQHYDQVINALKNNKHIFCQKPLARNRLEVETILNLAKEKNKIVWIDMSYRYTAAMQTIKKYVQNNEIGRIYSIDVTFHNAYGPDKQWFFNPELSGGGCIIDLGIHMIDLALWICEFPAIERVASTIYSHGVRKYSRMGPVEDYGVAHLNLSNGAIVNLACSWNISAGCDAVIKCHVNGTRGALLMTNVNGSFYDFEVYHYKSRSAERIFQGKDDWGGRALVDWADKVISMGQYDFQSDQFLNVAEAIDQIYEGTIY